MAFITPFMLWGSLAAAIPVAIHLFFRSRYRTVPWAAMKFLLTSVEQTSRRLKFQEYALLLSRMAILVFFAVAMARPVNVFLSGGIWFVVAVLLSLVTLTWALSPFWQWARDKIVNFVVYGVSQAGMIGICVVVWLYFFWAVVPSSSEIVARGKGDAVDAVFVFDASYSMSAQDGDKSRLQRAKDAAIKVIDELPPYSTVQIVTCAGTTKKLVGPRSPANLDQARTLVKDLEISHLATDLSVGVVEAKDILESGQASNKELYVFSDMQKTGFEQEAEKLKAVLTEVKQKAVVHFVRCGTGKLNNVAVVGITPQTGIPRPGERVGFAILVKNTGPDTINDLTVTLAVDDHRPKDESAKKVVPGKQRAEALEPQKVKKLLPGETRAVTIDAKLEKPGLHVLTARAVTDELEADNRFDQVILVRKQINILVVDGNYHEKDADKSSSFFLMHALQPVRDTERAAYKYSPRVVPANLAASMHLKDQDVCILVNCALAPREGKARVLPPEFVEALDPFVRKGKGLVVFSGDNVQPEPYNRILGKKWGLLPMPIKGVIKAKEAEKFLVNRTSFGAGPPGYWLFAKEKYYEKFNEVEVFQHLELDEASVSAERAKAKKTEAKKKDEDSEKKTKKDDKEAKEQGPVSVVVRLNSGLPLVAGRKVDSGEVLFVTTAAHHEGLDPKTSNPLWSDFATAIEFIPFMDVTMNHLVHGQTQTHNLQAGDILHWNPTDKFDHVYNLIHPDEKTVTRLGVPEKIDKRLVVVANDLHQAGVYHMVSTPGGGDSSGRTINVAEAIKKGTPIAVIPDLRESADLSTLSDEEINRRLGFTPIHIVAGGEIVVIEADRTNREWTTWALLAVFGLIMFEVAFAWWCGRAW